MNASSDDNALYWEGDEPATDRAPAAQQPRASLELHGSRAAALVFALIALAASVGWIVFVTGNPVRLPSVLGIAMYQLGELLAILAAPLWFLVALYQSRERARIIAWGLGALVTAPWPLVVGVVL